MTSQENQPPNSQSQLKWRPWQAVIAVILVFFSAQFLGGLLVVIYPIVKGWTVAATEAWFNHSLMAQFSFVLITELITIGLLIWLLKWRKTPLSFLGLNKPKLKYLAYTLVGGLAYIPLLILVETLAKLVFPSLNLEQQQQIGFDTARSAPELTLVLFSLVLLPAFVEELLMRGFLQGILRKFWRFWLVAITVSLLFAAAHLEFGNGAPLLWVAAIDTFVLSLVLVVIREKSGSLWPCIWLHLTKNSVAFVYLFIIKS